MSRRRGLDQAAVVAAAADLINREGSEALSLTRLAQALGVQPPSLYNHVDGLPALLDALTRENSQRMAECLTAAAVGRSGRTAVHAVAGAYRGYIKANPGLYPLGLRPAHAVTPVDPVRAAADERTVAVAVAVMNSCGLQGDDALHAVRGLRSIVHGFASLELAGGFGLPLDLDESFRRLVTQFAESLFTDSEVHP